MHYSTTSKTRKVSALLLSTILATGMATPAFAGAPYKNVDPNGVDLTDGSFNFSMVEGSAGAGDSTIALVRTWMTGQGFTDNWSGRFITITGTGPAMKVAVNLGAEVDIFSLSGGVLIPAKANGATLTASGSGYIYRSADGTQIDFNSPTEDLGGTSNLCNSVSTTNCTLLATHIVQPNGRSADLSWSISANCPIPALPDDPQNCTYSWKMTGVTNNAGYGFTIAFVSNSVPPRTNPGPTWFRRSTVTFTGASASIVYSYPSSTVTQITNAAGRAWRFAGALSSIKRPGSASVDTTTIAYNANGVTSVIKDGVTTNYSRTLSGSTATMTVTHPIAGQTVVVSDMILYRPTSVSDPLGRVTTQTYDSSGRPIQTTMPEGNKVVRAFDARGNVTSTTFKAKSGSGLADIITSAAYPASCTNPVTCNSPTTTTDARGNVTDYVYNAMTGLVTSVTAPAPTTGAIRPQTRFGYGVTAGITLPTSISACQTTASCIGGADEVKTTIAYNANLLPGSVTSGAGDGSLSATTSFSYDAAGNRTYVDGPQSGTADTTRTIYNAAREPVGVIAPDPDGAGVRLLTAQRMTYNADGQVSQAEFGTVTAQTDAAWAAFSSSQQAVTTYDANARPVKHEAKAGGTTYSVSQVSYDARGRVDCSATRMDAAVWAGQTNACLAQTTGTLGADRISKAIYDAADRVTRTQTAYGTAEQADEVTTAYTGNGLVASVLDAENNKTGYSYDGHDRLIKTEYPSTAKGANAVNAADYEQLVYDANGNVTTRRLRDGASIAYGYDNLDRLVSKDVPNLAYGETDVTYTYDLLSRLISGTNSDGLYTWFGYDALGRTTSDNNYFDATYFQHDAAGRMTKLTWVDGFYVNYDHDVTGQVTKIRENGAPSGVGILATYDYDNLGRRTSVTYGNGVAQSYAFDPVSRLQTLTTNLAGTAQDQTATFGYNPASQTDTLTKSNDAYAWAGHYNIDRVSAGNGLNQLTATTPVGGQVSVPSLTYDARGNATAIGSSAYSYSSENRMATAPGASLYYDPLGRLWFSTAGTRFDHAGSTLVTERGDGNAILRRYVHGPGTDAPIVAYEGSGTSDRRFLTADERGSIVAVTDSTGALTGVNTYDEYGNPGSSNASIGSGGRFGYTGQAWLPELGMWYYKARIYNPSLGRFMQTDPIGYADSMNLYNYVGGDPVNFADPKGSCGTETSRKSGVNCGEKAARAYVAKKLGLTGSDADAAVNALLQYGAGTIDLETVRFQIGFFSSGGIIVNGFVSSNNSGLGWQTTAIGSFGTSIGAYVIPDGGALYNYGMASFISGALVGSGKKDQFAGSKLVRMQAVKSGTLFRIPSGAYVFGSFLLQANATRNGVSGIVEYISPINLDYFKGNPIINHARFIPGVGVTGYANNWDGRYNCMPPTCI